MSEFRSKTFSVIQDLRNIFPHNPFLRKLWRIYSTNIKRESALGSNTGDGQRESQGNDDEISQISNWTTDLETNQFRLERRKRGFSGNGSKKKKSNKIHKIMIVISSFVGSFTLVCLKAPFWLDHRKLIKQKGKSCARKEMYSY